jgi:hypothetical protein
MIEGRPDATAFGNELEKVRDALLDWADAQGPAP